MTFVKQELNNRALRGMSTSCVLFVSGDEASRAAGQRGAGIVLVNEGEFTD